ncbi:uncharacterized protein PV09_00976 [Verruconis gallopava]|uniref:Heterokaryon incompatibility domain-containing protein n=1 Tax=Verruconis gallopava TaxID=253628 RepID=A0A0D1Z518_9PEZI|nr:uncharacterized protein PV09_00976 [Verruconis gallopava]KIW08032.1 hypothetical protein PV09_00976 [Verruconis gallopava]
MGSSNSKTGPEQQPLSWREAIGRRLRLWREFRPFVVRIVNAVGFAGRNVIAGLLESRTEPERGSRTESEDRIESQIETQVTHESSKKEEPVSSSALAKYATTGSGHEDLIPVESKGNEQDEQDGEDRTVTVIETLLAEALRAISVEDLEDIDDDGDQDRLAPVSKNQTGTVSDIQIPSEIAHKNLGSKGKQELMAKAPDSEHNLKKKVAHAKLALTKRLQRYPAVPEGSKGPEPDEEEQGIAVEVVRSSLDVALPTYIKRKKAGSSEFSQPRVPSALSFERRELTYDMVLEESENLGDIWMDSPDDFALAGDEISFTVPANIQEERTKNRRSDLQWAKQLYSRSRLDGKSIRLIDILPAPSGPVKVELSTKPLIEVKNDYEALSYTWGDPKWGGRIRVNDIEVPVTGWLALALESLRLPTEKRTVWADAICINQADLVEKSLEIPKMGDIYRFAKRVVIFHGAPSTTTPAGSLITALFKFLTRFDQEDGTEMPNRAEEDPFVGFDKAYVCKGFIDFCCRPWWRRVWTMQEFYLATDEPIWQWGATGASNAALKRDIEALMEASWDLYGGKQVEQWIHRQVEGATGKPVTQFGAEVRRISELIQRRHTSHGFDIPSRLYRSLDVNATNPRDLVYGLREMFDPVFRRVFVPDYRMPVQLLYACLAVFLIQFEGWADVLWWYPHGFADENLPSWLPDFRKRVIPDELEILPRDSVLTETHHLKLLVLDHAIHAEGYFVDTVEGVIVVDKEDTHAILRSLWDFDKISRESPSALTDEMTGGEQIMSLFRTILELYNASSWQRPGYVLHRQRSVLAWTADWTRQDCIPSHVIDCFPYGENLMWKAFKHGQPPYPEPQGDLRTGILNEIFRPEVAEIFRKTIAQDFISDCIFDWDALDFMLNHLATESPWSSPDARRWQALTSQSGEQHTSWIQHRADEIQSFLNELARKADRVRDGFRYLHEICALVILGSDSYSSFVDLVTALRSAGERLKRLTENFEANVMFNDPDPTDESLKKKMRMSNAITTHYSGRYLFWTRRGLLGMTSPGVELKGGETLLMLDGLSFPVVARDFNEKQGRGRLSGCSIIQGFELSDRIDISASVPDGFELGSKRLFKFI